MKYWKIISDNLSKAGWSWGWERCREAPLTLFTRLSLRRMPQRFRESPSTSTAPSADCESDSRGPQCYSTKSATMIPEIKAAADVTIPN
jgi:hypothetical protein